MHSPFESTKTSSNSDTQKSTDMLIQELQNKYSHLNFTFSSFSDQSQLRDYTSTHSGTNNIIIAPELLDKMLSNKSIHDKVTGILDDFSKYKQNIQSEILPSGKTLISMGLVLDADANLSAWTASSEKSEQFSPPSFPTRDSYEFHLSKYREKKDQKYETPYKYSKSSNLLRLANAKNVNAVRGLIASNYSEISKVKLHVTDKVEAAVIIRKIKSVIQNGNIKIARLHREERIHDQKELAAKQQKIRRERLLAEQLRRKRMARKGQEHCQTICMDDIFPNSSSEEIKHQSTVSGSISTAPSLPSGYMPASPSVSTPQTPTSPVTVSVSVNISV